MKGLTHEQRRTRIERVKFRLNAGASPELIAESEGLSLQYVESFRRQIGLRPPPRITTLRLIGRLCQEFRTFDEVGRELGMKRQAVYQMHKAAKEAGIPVKRGDE